VKTLACPRCGAKVGLTRRTHSKLSVQYTDDYAAKCEELAALQDPEQREGYRCATLDRHIGENWSNF
jgi:hypothetical protein